MNQSDYERIIKKLKHLEKFIGQNISDDQIDVYVESLSKFSDKILTRGFRKLAESHKYNYYPKLPQILQACSDASTERTYSGVSGELNFSQPSNGDVCDCGNHHGTGIWSHFERASVYAWFREKCSFLYDSQRRRYLETYEEAHGHVSPNM